MHTKNDAMTVENLHPERSPRSPIPHLILNTAKALMNLRDTSCCCSSCCCPSLHSHHKFTHDVTPFYLGEVAYGLFFGHGFAYFFCFFNRVILVRLSLERQYDNGW